MSTALSLRNSRGIEPGALLRQWLRVRTKLGECFYSGALVLVT